MKVRIKKTMLWVAVLLAGCMTSCQQNDDAGGSEDEGYVMIRLQNDLAPIEITKADTDPIIYHLEIVDSKGHITKSYDDHTQIPDQVPIKAGAYTVKARNAVQETDAGFETPYYAGETPLTVKAGVANPVNVVCSLANVKVSVSFSEAIKANFSEYAATVTNQDGGSLIFSETENRAGYLKNTGELVWTLNLKNNNGTLFQLSETIEHVEARQHYRLTFNVDVNGNPSDGGINSDITIDESTNEHNHDIDIVLNPKAKPMIAGSGFDIDAPLQVSEGLSATYDVSMVAEGKIKDATITHTSNQLSALGIPTTFSLVSVDPTTAALIQSKGLTWSTPVLDALSTKISFGPLFASLPLGDYPFELVVIDSQNQRTAKTLQVTIQPNVEVTTLSMDDIWATFGTFKAQWNTLEKPTGIGFVYKKESESNWISVPESQVTVSGKSYSARVKGLTPATSYQVKAVTANETGANIYTFTTEAADQLDNMNFDSWSNNTTLTGPWSSGNNAFVKMTYQENTTIVAGSAAKLMAKAAVGKFAAGNVFVGGNFKVVGTTGGEMDFGKPYTCRPTTLTGYYNYSPGTVNYANAPYTALNGTTDSCNIFVLLTDWEAPFHVNTSTGTFINLNAQEIIAYGVMGTDKPTTGFQQFTINLEYRNKRKPKYVVVVATTSKYGDYFTGSTSSVMYVDEFSFGFDAPSN